MQVGSVRAAFGVLLLISSVVAFGRLERAGSAAFAPATHAAPPRVTIGTPGTPSRWSYRITNTGYVNVRVVFPLAVLTAFDGLAVIDARTGAERWRRTDVGAVSTILRRDAIAADADGGVERVALASGAVRWRTGRICASPETAFAVGMLVASGDDVFAGCVDSGRLVRIDASSGVVRAERASLGAFPISDVRALRGGVVVAGWTSSGAVMRYNAALLRRSDFSTLAELPQDTQFIGMAGAMAIFDDRCCNGRFDGPVTVMRYDVLRNVLSSPVALSRDPDPFRGMGATTAIVGSRLISSSIPYLDDYGDARAPRTTPQRLARGLVEPAMYLADGKIFEERRASDGRIDDEIRDIGHPEPRVVWRSDADAVPDYDPDSAREVVAFTDKPSKRPRHASSERPTARRSEATRRAAHSPPTATSSSPTVSIAISASTEQKRSGDTRYRRSLVVPHRHQPVKALE